MTQLYIRVKDEAKEKADCVLLTAGYSLNSYLSVITDYIAETGSLPFQIRYNPASVNSVDIFTEILERFRTVWGRFKHFIESIKPGLPLPYKTVLLATQDLEDTYLFYRRAEDLILSAPIKPFGSSTEESQRSKAGFGAINQLYNALRQSINNLASLAVISREHLVISINSIREAEGFLNQLQAFTSNHISVDAFNQMIIRDALEAIMCAKMALARNNVGEGIPLYDFCMWHEKYYRLLDSITSMQRRAAMTDATQALSDLCKHLSAIENYLDRLCQLRNGKVRDGVPADEDITEVAEELLRTFRLLAGDLMQPVPMNISVI